MTALGSTLFTRRARIIVPFLFAYGIALYLVAGTISDAFSGQTAPGGSELVIEPAPGSPSGTRAGLDRDAVSRALAAVERTGAIRQLVRDQPVSVIRSGPWTAGDGATGGPKPEAEVGVGVALTIELAEATDIDLGSLPHPDDATAPRSLEGTAPSLSRNVESLLVLYDPARDEIVAVHPGPRSAPPLPDELGPEPDVSPPNPQVDRATRAGDPGSGRARQVSSRD